MPAGIEQWQSNFWWHSFSGKHSEEVTGGRASIVPTKILDIVPQCSKSFRRGLPEAAKRVMAPIPYRCIDQWSLAFVAKDPTLQTLHFAHCSIAEFWRFPAQTWGNHEGDEFLTLNSIHPPNGYRLHQTGLNRTWCFVWFVEGRKGETKNYNIIYDDTQKRGDEEWAQQCPRQSIKAGGDANCRQKTFDSNVVEEPPQF